MPNMAILGTYGQFSQKLSDNFFSYLCKLSNIMMSFYGANAVLIESLLLGVQSESRGWDLVIFRHFPMLYNGAMQNEWRGPETCLI